MSSMNWYRTAQQEDRSLVGAYVQSTNAEAVELIGWTGFDFVILDLEHGAIVESDLPSLIRAADAAGIPCLARVPAIGPRLIGRILDVGAAGIVVPDIHTAEDVRTAVKAARYAPQGLRGACPFVRSVGYSVPDVAENWPSLAQEVNDSVLVWGIVESAEGVANIEDIVNVDGLDALSVGRFDLAQAMDLGGQVDHPDVIAAMQRVIDSAHAAGIRTIATALNPDPDRVRAELAWRHELGASILIAASDRQLMAGSLRRLRGAVDDVIGRPEQHGTP